jgi:hypothetical protein
MVFEDRVLREGRGNRRLEKTAYRGASWSVIRNKLQGDLINKDDLEGGGMQHVWGRGGVW